MNKVGIVILNYGTPKETCDLVLKIKDYKKLNRIVIVDNPCGDNSASLISKFINKLHNEKISLIISKENGGYAKGNNIGLRQLVEIEKCDICFIANPDISFEESDFEEILKVFNKYKEYGVLTCKRIVSDGSKLRQYWKLPSYGDILSDKFFLLRKIHKKTEVYTINSKTEVIDTQIAPGAFWGVRSDLLISVNFLDENTFLFYEENCFAKRIEKTRVKIGLVTKAQYCVLAGKASTEEMKRNGKMMKFLHDSQRHYVIEYLNIHGVKLFIYDILCVYNSFELLISGLRKKNKRKGNL